MQTAPAGWYATRRTAPFIAAPIRVIAGETAAQAIILIPALTTVVMDMGEEVIRA